MVFVSSKVVDTTNARVSSVKIDEAILERVRIEAFRCKPRKSIKEFIEDAVRLALPVRRAR